MLRKMGSHMSALMHPLHPVKLISAKEIFLPAGRFSSSGAAVTQDTSFFELMWFPPPPLLQLLPPYHLLAPVTARGVPCAGLFRLLGGTLQQHLLQCGRSCQPTRGRRILAIQCDFSAM